VAATARRFGIPYEGPGTVEPDDVAVDVPRPPHWGGFRLHPDAVELWVEGEFRIHDRARWTRSLVDQDGIAAAWSVTRLQP
jgi:pyridoxamine 5'-phosphate oxidase